jgi:S-adenosyl-L-methionine hydrolase (adenosine-forming)
MPDSIITLTTDFGYKDPFVGIMKGVILSIKHSVNIVDITHLITPQNILEASFVIENSFSFFPRKTIHVVVVDPGVGSVRRPIIVADENYFFVGPDNGVFSCIYRLIENPVVVHITSEQYFLSWRGPTFHGRDIFAPVAAWLSKGIEISNFGVQIYDYVTVQLPDLRKPAENIIDGEVIYIDSFGNLITNISAREIEDLSRVNPDRKPEVVVKGQEAPLKNYYLQATDDRLYSIINSFRYLELFVNKGNASAASGVTVGEKVSVILS